MSDAIVASTGTPITHDLQRSRLAALEIANEVRRARAQLKREIAEGTLSAADVLADPPALAARWQLADLLMSQRGWGQTRCKQFLRANSIADAKRIGELTPRQRQLLTEQLGTRDIARPAAAARTTALA